MPAKTPIILDRQQVARTVTGDPVIILLGETGAGKSTFISVAGRYLGTGPKIGHGLYSCTTDVAEYQVKNSCRPDQYVRLIDTPGFNDSTAKGDAKQLNKIIEWLKKEPNTQIAGIIFLQGIDQVRLNGDSKAFTPKKIPAPPGVVVVTTKWNTGPRETEELHERELFTIFTPVHRFDKTYQSAWEIINDIQQSASKRITREMFRKVLESSLQSKRWDVSIMAKIRAIFYNISHFTT